MITVHDFDLEILSDGLTGFEIRMIPRSEEWVITSSNVKRNPIIAVVDPIKRDVEPSTLPCKTLADIKTWCATTTDHHIPFVYRDHLQAPNGIHQCVAVFEGSHAADDHALAVATWTKTRCCDDGNYMFNVRWADDIPEAVFATWMRI